MRVHVSSASEWLSSRDQLLAQRGSAAFELNSGPLRGAIERSISIGTHYEIIFRTLIRFLEIGEAISKNAEFTIQAFRSLSFLSLNMAVGKFQERCRVTAVRLGA